MRRNATSIPLDGKLHPRDAASRDFSANGAVGRLLNVKKIQRADARSVCCFSVAMVYFSISLHLFFCNTSRMFERRIVRALVRPCGGAGVTARSDRPRNSAGDFPLWSWCGQLRFYLILFNRDECEISPIPRRYKRKMRCDARTSSMFHGYLSTKSYPRSLAARSASFSLRLSRGDLRNSWRRLRN